MKTVALLLVCFVALQNYVTVSGLQCIQCQNINATCLEPTVLCNSTFADVNVEILQGSKPDLPTITQTDVFRCFAIEAEKDGAFAILKGCIYNSVDVCAGKVSGANQKDCYLCNTDKCNSASSLTLSFGLLAGLVIAVRTFVL